VNGAPDCTVRCRSRAIHCRAWQANRRRELTETGQLLRAVGTQLHHQLRERGADGDPLQLLVSDIDAKCDTNTDPNVCAISNPGGETAPWSYTAKDGTSGSFPEFSFIEGGINVTSLLGGQSECFSSFMAETRSSQSATATLKDFALGGFVTCKLEVSKTCPAVTFNQATGTLDYAYHVTVTNSGFAPIYDVTVVDTPDGLSNQTFTLPSLAQGSSHTFDGTFLLTPGPSTPNPPGNSATVTAALSPGGAQTLSAGPATADCPPVSFSGDLTVSKVCSSRPEVQNDRVVVAVDISGQVCSTANQSPIDNVTVTDTPPIGTISLGTLQPGACANYSATYFPAALTIVNCTPSGLPHDQTYEDTVLAQGTLRFTQELKQNTVTAHCPLCP